MEYSRSLSCYAGCAYPVETEEEVANLKNRFAKLMMDQLDIERVEEMGWSARH